MFVTVGNRYTMPAFFVGALHIVLSSVLADVPPCYAEFTGLPYFNIKADFD